MLDQAGTKQGQREQEQLAGDGPAGKIKSFSQNESPDLNLFKIIERDYYNAYYIKLSHSLQVQNNNYSNLVIDLFCML